jgi:hypothetical protein
MLLDGLADLVSIRRDRQLFRIGNLRNAGRARRACGGGRGYFSRKRGLRGGNVIAAQPFGTQPVTLAPQTVLVARMASRERSELDLADS